VRSEVRYLVGGQEFGRRPEVALRKHAASESDVLVLIDANKKGRY